MFLVFLVLLTPLSLPLPTPLPQLVRGWIIHCTAGPRVDNTLCSWNVSDSFITQWTPWTVRSYSIVFIAVLQVPTFHPVFLCDASAALPQRQDLCQELRLVSRGGVFLCCCSSQRGCVYILLLVDFLGDGWGAFMLLLIFKCYFVRERACGVCTFVCLCVCPYV